MKETKKEIDWKENTLAKEKVKEMIEKNQKKTWPQESSWTQ